MVERRKEEVERKRDKERVKTKIEERRGEKGKIRERKEGEYVLHADCALPFFLYLPVLSWTQVFIRSLYKKLPSAKVILYGGGEVAI